jgi:hypothetical protein
MVRRLAAKAGLVGGYALAHWLHLGGPDASPLAWEVLAAAFGFAVLAYQFAELLLDDEGAERGGSEVGTTATRPWSVPP